MTSRLVTKVKKKKHESLTTKMAAYQMPDKCSNILSDTFLNSLWFGKRFLFSCNFNPYRSSNDVLHFLVIDITLNFQTMTTLQFYFLKMLCFNCKWDCEESGWGFAYWMSSQISLSIGCLVTLPFVNRCCKIDRMERDVY